jgi:hypothetical protein
MLNSTCVFGWPIGLQVNVMCAFHPCCALLLTGTSAIRTSEPVDIQSIELNYPTKETYSHNANVPRLGLCLRWPSRA